MLPMLATASRSAAGRTCAACIAASTASDAPGRIVAEVKAESANPRSAVPLIVPPIQFKLRMEVLIYMNCPKFAGLIIEFNQSHIPVRLWITINNPARLNIGIFCNDNHGTEVSIAMIPCPAQIL